MPQFGRICSAASSVPALFKGAQKRGVAALPGARNRGPRTPRARRARTPRASRASRRARRASARPLVVRAPPAGARVERGSGARAERRTGREKRKRRGPPRRAMSRLSCGGDQPPTRFTRAARVRARVARRPPRAAPSLRTERRPKRRRETTGDDRRRRGGDDHRGARCPC